MGPDRADSRTRILKHLTNPEPAQPPPPQSPLLSPWLHPQRRPPSSSVPRPPRTLAHHAAPPRHLLLPPNAGTLLAAAAYVCRCGGGCSDCEVRGLLLLEHSVVVCIGGCCCRAAGGEGAQLRDGGLRASTSTALGHPVPAHRCGARREARGAHAGVLGRGGAPPRQVGALPHRQGAPKVQEVQPRAPGSYTIAVRMRGSSHRANPLWFQPVRLFVQCSMRLFIHEPEIQLKNRYCSSGVRSIIRGRKQLLGSLTDLTYPFASHLVKNAY